MRRTIRIYILFAAALLVFQACRVVESDRDRPDIAAEGYVAYQAVQTEVLSPVINILDITLKADRYLKAVDEYERFYVAEMLFGGEDVYCSGNRMMIGYSDYYPYRADVVIEFSEESILSPGTEWTCSMNGKEVVVRCTGADTWSLILLDDASTSYGFNGVVEEMSFSATVSDIEKLVLDRDDVQNVGKVALTYTVETSGRYVQTGMVDGQKTLTVVDFTTMTPTTAGTARYPGLYNGGFSLHLDAEGPEMRDEDIIVTLSDQSTNTRVTVEYMGVSSYWITNEPQ